MRKLIVAEFITLDGVNQAPVSQRQGRKLTSANCDRPSSHSIRRIHEDAHR
jgi:hypothetical protein